jgi:hypothetical protein
MTVLRIRGVALPAASPSTCSPTVTGGPTIRSPVPTWPPRAGWSPASSTPAGRSRPDPHQALAAGSWAARAYLGLDPKDPADPADPAGLADPAALGGALAPGTLADAVVYDADPRTDLTLLDTPRAVILRGRLITPP